MSDKKEVSASPDPLLQGVSDLSRRLRVLEERYTTLRRKGQLTDDNLIHTEKEVHEELERVSQQVTELHRLIGDLDEKLDRFLEQVKQAAPRQDVLILKKYLEMWDPVRYVTRDELTRVLNEGSFKKNASRNEAEVSNGPTDPY